MPDKRKTLEELKEDGSIDKFSKDVRSLKEQRWTLLNKLIYGLTNNILTDEGYWIGVGELCLPEDMMKEAVDAFVKFKKQG